MATPTLYRHTDTSAPVLTGQAGSLISLLDAILVNGYGSKAAAGWTKPYSDTNKAVYRNSGTQTFVRVVDDNARFGSLAVAELWGYSSMSDVDTGTDQFPTALQISGDATARKQITKSMTTDSTARNWAALATDKTLILAIEYGSQQYASWVYFIGDFARFIPSDTTNFLLSASSWEETTSPSTNTIFFNPENIETTPDLDTAGDDDRHYGALKQSQDATVGADAVWLKLQIADDTSNSPRSGSNSFDDPPHPVFGYPLTDIFVSDVNSHIIRGKIPSMKFACVDMQESATGLSNLQTISLDDPVIGSRQYLYATFNVRWNGTGNGGGYMIDVDADDWP